MQSRIFNTIALLLLISNTSLADDLPPPIGFGISGLQDQNNQNHYSLNIGDIHHFNQKSSYPLGISQYGYGKGQIDIGDSLGVNISAMSGTIIYGLWDKEEGFSPEIGMEMGGRLLLNSKSGINNYYEWFPGVSFGPQYDIGWARMLLIGRTGVATGDYDNQSLLPDFRLFYGEGLYINTKLIQFGLDNINFGYNRLYSTDCLFTFSNTAVGVRAEKIYSVTQPLSESRFTFLIKYDLF